MRLVPEVRTSEQCSRIGRSDPRATPRSFAHRARRLDRRRAIRRRRGASGVSQRDALARAHPARDARPHRARPLNRREPRPRSSRTASSCRAMAPPTGSRPAMRSQFDRARSTTMGRAPNCKAAFVTTPGADERSAGTAGITAKQQVASMMIVATWLAHQRTPFTAVRQRRCVTHDQLHTRTACIWWTWVTECRGRGGLGSAAALWLVGLWVRSGRAVNHAQDAP